jgi:hypothetical protein
LSLPFHEINITPPIQERFGSNSNSDPFSSLEKILNAEILSISPLENGPNRSFLPSLFGVNTLGI